MLIRRFDAGAGDGPATFSVFLRAVRETSPAHYDPAQIAAWASADPEGWAHERERRTTFVAVEDGTVVGVADVDEEGLIDVLFVDPAVGRRGTGSALLAAVVAQAARRDLPRLHARASLTAEAVFVRAGFHVVRRRRPVVRGVRFTNLEMVRPTTPEDRGDRAAPPRDP